MTVADPGRVLGHEQARDLLARTSAQALLFTGPEGIGRRRVARWFAAFLNCAAPVAGPCGECRSCLHWVSGTHPDYLEVGAPATTSSGRLNRRPEIRIGQLVERPGEEAEPLGPWLERRPAFRWRVGVIDGADRLTTAAANSFLKFLEEPPSWARVVLIAPSPESVLPTVRSRCAVLRFAPVDTAGLTPPEHPGHRLGRPGLLEAAQADPEGYARAAEAAAEFVDALPHDLERVFAAADELEEAWSGQAAAHLPVLLRERLRGLPVGAYAQAIRLLEECEEAIAAYAAPGLAVRVFALELRAALGVAE